MRALKVAFDGNLKRPAVRLTRADVVARLDKFLKAGSAPMASRTAAYGRAAFRWAQKRGMVAVNPFETLPAAGATEARERVLDDVEIAEVWDAAGTLKEPWRGFFRLAVLTMQRREAVAGMRWSEIADDLTMWRIPGARQKNAKPHDVHLSGAARDVLRSIKAERERQLIERLKRRKGDVPEELPDLVFTTTGMTPISGLSKAKLALDAAIEEARQEVAKKAGVKPAPLAPWRLHDLRRTGVSALARLGFDAIVCDLLLAHKPSALSAVARVYQRHDFATERQRALDAWAAHVLGVSKGDNVVPIMSRAG